MTQYIRKMRVALCTAFVATALMAAGAQTVTGSIRGLVTDPSGAVVPGSEITAINVNTGVKTKTTTDRTGNYNIQTLSVGSYKVTAARQGFKTTSVGPISLEIDQIAKIDVKLEVGEVSATVEVASESGAILQTENAALATTITANTLESMPLPGQNFSAATVFVPGAVLPTYGSLGSTQGTERVTSFAASTQPSFNGNRMQTNNYIFDGTDINEPLQNTIAYNPAPEAIGQMRVITGNADAEYGNVNGGEILTVTKSGTNKFHGSLYAFYENQDGTANLWSNNYNKIAKGVFHQNLFGGTFGGPVFRNKLFFFVDYEGFRQTSAGTSVISVPSRRMRKAISLSSWAHRTNLISPFLRHNTSSCTTPRTASRQRTPYVNNQIPVNNPVAQYIFAHPEFYPLPNRPSTNANSPDTNNYGGYNKSAVVNNQGDVRVDYVATSARQHFGALHAWWFIR